MPGALQERGAGKPAPLLNRTTGPTRSPRLFAADIDVVSETSAGASFDCYARNCLFPFKGCFARRAENRITVLNDMDFFDRSLDFQITETSTWCCGGCDCRFLEFFLRRHCQCAERFFFCM